MKVTKIIREYIEESVHEKFLPAYEAAAAKSKELEAEKDRIRGAIKNFKLEMAAYVRDQFAQSFGSHYRPETMEAYKGSISVSLPWGLESGFIDVEDPDKQKAKVREKEEKAVKNILIELELGATKADLDRLLSEIVVEV